jgi:hypothetical protein
MKAQDIFRQYSAEAEFVSQSPFTQQTKAQVLATAGYPNFAKCAVNPDMPFRKIWFLFSPDYSVTVNAVEADLVCTFQGIEKYRQPMLYGTAPYIDGKSWWFGLTSNAARQPGATDEVLVIQIGLGLYYIHPIRLNITCDTIYINVRNINDTGVATYDCRLFIQSQRGV